MRKNVLKKASFVAGLLCCVAATAAQADTSGAIVFNGMKNDGAFNELGFIGTERAEKEVGIKIRQRVAADEAETIEALRVFADRGVEHLLTLGFANTEAVKTVAAEYPDVKFTIIDGYIPDMPNVRSVLFAEQESGFIAGYAAGLKTKTDKVGTIGGMDIPPVRKFMCGFAAGAKKANPDVTIVSEYVADTPAGFRDVDGGMAIAEKMTADGVDVIFAPAGRAAEGAAKAAEKAGVFAIMVDANQNDFIPGTVLTTALKRVDEAAFLTWQAAMDGSWQSGIVTMTAADKGVDWAVDAHNQSVVEDIKGQVDTAMADLAAGSVAIEPVDGVEGCADVL
ncbi:BMP family ABC transporter substrate-binding protein [Roseibium denhamense]|uniref:Nucleoside-binding protein n=1 Tax=Roseibium denhamense TaxID=76305 RepID=A0ABY1NSM3_9HYPH|nr:BMP family ABC transporter substrate-binding protein [Roseibium denhamense]MTI08165.1 BMP family ABC transporter substrate-binding protein [Roseibium denhamense]SMP16967.1 nucleoside-binding protein [Roseibium denhamense]